MRTYVLFCKLSGDWTIEKTKGETRPYYYYLVKGGRCVDSGNSLERLLLKYHEELTTPKGTLGSKVWVLLFSFLITVGIFLSLATFVYLVTRWEEPTLLAVGFLIAWVTVYHLRKDKT